MKLPAAALSMASSAPATTNGAFQLRRGGEATLAPAARPANRGLRPRAINRQERAAQTIRMTARHGLAQLLTMRTTIRQPDGMRGRARLSLTLAAVLAIASLANALCLWALI